MSNSRKHISFSELKKWNSCPYSRKLAYEDGIKLFNGNSYTAFGEAMHETIESIFVESLGKNEAKDLFRKKLLDKLTNCPDRISHVEKNMETEGSSILEEFREEFGSYFGEDFTVFSIEEELYEPMGDHPVPYNFKGFIDMVIKDSKGDYHIIDWKTCSWGWNFKKRTDPMVVYQLMFYKNFFAQKHNVDQSKIQTHFGLLKRTAKKDRVEIFPVTSGKKRISNSLALLDKALFNITSGVQIKNRLSCSSCEYYKTEHCS